MYIEFSRIEEAISDLEKALECDPKRSDVLMMLAELEDEQGTSEPHPDDGVKSWILILVTSMLDLDCG